MPPEMPVTRARYVLIALAAASVATLAAGPVFENRWEGLATEHNASPAWELRSFVAWVEPYAASNSVDLTVRYYVPDATRAFIEAREIVPLKNYLMRPSREATTPGWRTFTGWPTRDVLLLNQISSDRLGMLISIGARGDGVTRFAPAIIFHSKPPEKVTTYTVALSTASALKGFTATVAGANYRKTYPQSPADDNSTVAITFDAAGIPEGWTTFSFSAGHQDLALPDKVNISIEFFHKQPS